MKKQTFKCYSTEQNELPLTKFDDLVPQEHLARAISTIVDEIDTKQIEQKYKGGGASAYDPKMLLKAWLLAYCYDVYSSRGVAKMLAENVVFMWIAGRQRPDFRTLNNFRNRLENTIKDIFKQVVRFAITKGLLEGRTNFVDGTLITANANRHKIIWKRSVQKALAKTEKELDEIAEEVIAYSKELDEKEDDDNHNDEINNNGERKYTEKEILELAKQIEGGLKGKRGKSAEEKNAYEKSKRIQKLNERKAREKGKEKKLAGRNSYAKTDPDASARRDKEDVLRPVYDEVIATENQFVTNYEVDNCGERKLFRRVLRGSKRNTRRKMKAVVGDGGFGDEENYAFLEKNEMEAYVKHNRYYKEKSKKWNEERVRSSHFKKHETEDAYICPEGNLLSFERIRKTISDEGYEKVTKRYYADEHDCSRCQMKAKCTKAKARSLEISEDYERLRKAANARLATNEGKAISRRRGMEVETPFGERKHNRRNRRFLLRGRNKVNIESGLFYLAYDIRKLFRWAVKKLEKSTKTNGVREILSIA